MKISFIIDTVVIITGILILIFGLNSADVDMEKIFGWFIITLGVLNISVGLIKRENYKKK